MARTLALQWREYIKFEIFLTVSENFTDLTYDYPSFSHVEHHDWWLVRVTLVVAFGFLSNNFGRWQEPTNDHFAKK